MPAEVLLPVRAPDRQAHLRCHVCRQHRSPGPAELESGSWRKEPFQTEKFKALFDTQWTEEQKSTKVKWDDEEADERASAWKTLEHYFLETPIKSDERPEAVEVPVEADLSPTVCPGSSASSTWFVLAEPSWTSR